MVGWNDMVGYHGSLPFGWLEAEGVGRTPRMKRRRVSRIRHWEE